MRIKPFSYLIVCGIKPNQIALALYFVILEQGYYFINDPSLLRLQDKLYQDEYQAVVNEEEKEAISSKLSEASAWLDDEGYSAGTKELKEKLTELKKLCKAMFFRVDERKKWPDRLAALENMLNHSTIFLKWVLGRFKQSKSTISIFCLYTA